MKALTIKNYGNLGQALLSEVDGKDPENREVKIRIEAASVNPLDLRTISWRTCPRENSGTCSIGILSAAFSYAEPISKFVEEFLLYAKKVD